MDQVYLRDNPPASRLNQVSVYALPPCRSSRSFRYAEKISVMTVNIIFIRFPMLTDPGPSTLGQGVIDAILCEQTREGTIVCNGDHVQFISRVLQHLQFST
jgi:hypothetical protein